MKRFACFFGSTREGNWAHVYLKLIGAQLYLQRSIKFKYDFRSAMADATCKQFVYILLFRGAASQLNSQLLCIPVSSFTCESGAGVFFFYNIVAPN